MSVEAQGSEVELTAYEQEMVDLVDTKEAKAEGQANPEEAPEYQEEIKESEIDYKAEYEKLKAAQEVKDPTVSEEPQKTLEVPEEKRQDNKPNEENPKADETGKLTHEQMGKYTEEFNSNGGISEESYGELEELGISKAVVDGYIQGQAAIQEARTNKVYESVGGQDVYSDMIQWAKDNWTAPQIEVFNNNVNSGGESQVMFSVEALKSQYEAAQGSPIPKRALTGTSKGASQGSKGFETKDEMYKAMNNKLYGKDAAYTNMVASKIALSTFY